APARECRRFVGIAGQQCEEAREPLAVKSGRGRQLPEDRTKLLAEVGNARREEVGQRLLAVAQLQHVRDEPRTFDAENEAVRRLVAPPRVVLGALQRVERTVDLDRRDVARRVLELAPLWQPRWIERSAPGRVAPAGDTD